MLGLLVLTVDDQDVGVLHRSVLDLVAEIAGRLGGGHATALGTRPAAFDAGQMPRLRRELEQVAAFADATRRHGWSLGELAAAPAERSVPVLETEKGTVWVNPVRGFELHDAAGVRPLTELDDMPGTARRTPATRLMGPLLAAAARARRLEIRERD
ncbi:hypothetical protein [Actinomadura chokoriensis]|uniref:hypothetical protein n=1 Tax=Actinomadura chokoriensis TaxID=454156 RepID=UPI0031F95BA2